MPGRGSRGKPKAPLPPRVAPPEEATTQIETSPELLPALRDDESERPTIRLPSRPPFAPPEDEGAVAMPPIPEMDPLGSIPSINRRADSTPTFSPSESINDPGALEEPLRAARIRGRDIIGPDGVARVLGYAELEEATRPFIPSKMLLRTGKAKKKR